MVVQSVVRLFLPPEFQGFLFSKIHGFFCCFCNEMTMVIGQYDGYSQNDLFGAAQVLLATKQSLSMQRVQVIKSPKENHFTLAMDQNQMPVDTFHGVKLNWVFVLRQVDSGHQVHQGSTVQHEVQHFELSFHKKNREIVVKSYLPFLIDEAKSIKQGNKRLKLCTPGSNANYL
ncbi:protein HYPER-SENSITIVITY-RELATED 4-like [Eucalyptus grandis]|uniref:protein HYPER-SENSITIVITY-RELATED 4-like n=1 Tax=Eucalyptus grandis TaxID=71139 RepID=UPI00192F07A7|nr:protein HYPER-SENSITIVITY-RELATED 4-like [Eucalyptus grandis]